MTLFWLGWFSVLLAGCHGSGPPHDLSPLQRLAPCPQSPNCVSSLATDDGHRVEPLPIARSASESLAILRRVIEAMPRATVVASTEYAVRAEFRSRIGFVDDVTCIVDGEGGVIQIRSASRTGYWDLGVNRRRVGTIRSRYLEAIRNVEGRSEGDTRADLRKGSTGAPLL